ncbi:MAG: hypothetical protein SGI94_20950 [Saprospiraceae bacterium]|nr:hypothetical protein [Saprospiraceae bacterium]
MVYNDYFQAINDHKLFGEDATINGAFESSVTWKQADIDTLPLILCGPILRRCEPESVTVWVALKESVTTAELLVYADDSGSKSGDPLLAGISPGVLKQLGKHLFIGAITAKPVGDKKLEYGKSYLYNLTFGTKGDLKTESVLKGAVITYPGYELPALMLPPGDVSKLHFVHGSCREMTGTGEDAMVALDALLLETWNTNRPQQLFLTGDQIYSDEGSAITEHLITQTGKMLLAGADSGERWEEIIRKKDATGKDETDEEAQIWPSKDPIHLGTRGGGEDNDETRSYIHEDCGFTASSNHHLFTLGEFFGSYLYAWSDVLWPAFYKDSLKNKNGQLANIKTNLINQIKDPNRADGYNSEESEGKSGYWIYIYEVLRTHWDDIQSFRLLLNPDGLLEPESKIGTIIEAIELPADILTSPEIGLLEDIKKGLKKKQAQSKDEAQEEFKTKVRQVMTIIEKIKLPVAILNRMHFAEGLPKVRCALANISTYMMFDDHEVTDDWHLTREWVQRAYSLPMGRRVMQNALSAFAVFQAWGNTPERFEFNQPGGKFLNALQTWIEHKCQDTTAEETLANALKIPFTDSKIAEFQQIGRGEGLPEIFDNPLVWNFRYEHPKYEVLALDARTFRSFPGALYRPSEHLSKKAIDAQLPAATVPTELTIVISPCNVVTIPMFRNFLTTVALPHIQIFTKWKEKRFRMLAYDPDQADSWEIGSPVFEYLVKRLATRAFKRETENLRQSRVLILSGDVHFSYAGRMAYWADENSATDRKEMIVAHLTASGFKNEAAAWSKLKLDEFGYEFSDVGAGDQQLPDPETMIGYAKRPVALNKEKTDEIMLRTRWFPNYYPHMILEEPLVLPYHKIHPEVKVPRPEWFYRVDFMRGEKANNVTDVNVITNMNHLLYARGQKPSTEIIRRNNFASVTFDWSGEGTLTGGISATDKSFNILLKPGRPFPQAPFFVRIGDEIIYVLKATSTASSLEGDVKFEQVRRGRGNTEAAAHAMNQTVRIRRSANQLHWINDRPRNTSETVAQKLTRFKVPLDPDDPQFAKPSPNVI